MPDTNGCPNASPPMFLQIAGMPGKAAIERGERVLNGCC